MVARQAHSAWRVLGLAKPLFHARGSAPDDGARLRAEGAHRPAAGELQEAILADVGRFVASAPRSDDIAVLVVQREQA
jgi:hypothetical protein